MELFILVIKVLGPLAIHKVLFTLIGLLVLECKYYGIILSIIECYGIILELFILVIKVFGPLGPLAIHKVS